ncbi:IucA/IucC family protein [Chitinimonas taiwanensis]|uniref:Aerobactin synthase n=1 Tax=Chitinimonas taiwanensis DSM 18899 TaxID=1121279 RepID=A0A1K2HFV0_9NEIS|nr:IucA/IucC family protein [Chitinimonas taiwanensis]SFZ75557.1 aerobactin synthase [Chitinimonas taiwanensis DSM 18899]
MNAPLNKAAYSQLDPVLWQRANQRLLEKALSELSYEGVISPERGVPDAQGRSEYRLPLADASSQGYRWQGWTNRWDQPCITPGSVRTLADDQPAQDAVTVLRELLSPLALPANTLANYLRETLNTLSVDCQLLEARQGLSAADWLTLPTDQLQSLLDGHPKAIPSKGRVGWGVAENRLYGPERSPRFRLHWLAVARSLAETHAAPGWNSARLLAASCDEAERLRLQLLLAAQTAQPDQYWLLPVHPWQWQAHIAPQFAALLASRTLIHLGEAGDHYTPQQSLRTLSNTSRPKQLNLKLPLTLLNTSAWRGLSARYLAITPALSDWLQDLLEDDPLLAERRCGALAEPAAAFVPHPLYHGLPEVPYQFDEMLGAVWRESGEARLGPGEQVVMAAVLQQQDDHGRPLVAELIRQSGLSARDWLSRLFELAVVPLYHLQARYGLGFIAHGQNLMLRLADGAPAGVLLKDYQGDLFRAEADWAQPEGLAPAVWNALPSMPPHYLLHNLWTGLFGSVFRFMASVLHEAGLYDETAFYQLLAGTLQRYQTSQPQLAERFAQLDLFAAQMPRLSLNRARFAAGYGDAASRPIHALGPTLANPLRFDLPQTGAPT